VRDESIEITPIRREHGPVRLRHRHDESTAESWRANVPSSNCLLNSRERQSHPRRCPSDAIAISGQSFLERERNEKLIVSRPAAAQGLIARDDR
jgi:hypothetical protein